MHIIIDPHALVRAQERGANAEEIRKTVQAGEQFPAKRRRMEFRKIFVHAGEWEGKYYEHKQLHVFAAEETQGWYVVTVIVKFF